MSVLAWSFIPTSSFIQRCAAWVPSETGIDGDQGPPACRSRHSWACHHWRSVVKPGDAAVVAYILLMSLA